MPTRANGHDPLGVAAQLVALAGDQAETRSRVDRLANAVEDLTGQVAGLAQDTGSTGEQLDAVRTALGELADAVERLAAEPPPAPLWVWADMDADTRRARLRELAAWVGEVLVDRYRLAADMLPRCWYRHPEAVEELSWLYLEWARVYRGRGSSTTAAGEWHDRWLPGVLTRLGQRLASCRTDHRDPVRHPPPPTDAGFDTYLATLDHPPAQQEPGQGMVGAYPQPECALPDLGQDQSSIPPG